MIEEILSRAEFLKVSDNLSDCDCVNKAIDELVTDKSTLFKDVVAEFDITVAEAEEDFRKNILKEFLKRHNIA